jgi:cytochrome c5
LQHFKTLTNGLVGLALTGLLAACGSGTGGGDELGTAPATSPVPITQGNAAEGEIIYDNYCSRCHSLQPHDPVGSPELAGMGDVIAVKLQDSHMGITLNTTELSDVIAFANQGQVGEPAPEPDPTQDPEPGQGPDPVPVDGQSVYDANCAGCHSLGSYDTSGSPELAGKGSVVNGKIGGGHMGVSLSGDETALIGWVDENTPLPAPSPTPTPDPVPTPDPTPAPAPTPEPLDGKTVYDANCAGCHSREL